MTLPIKANYTNDVITSLGEFQVGDAIPVSQGGTGATTALGARENLGITDMFPGMGSFTAKASITQGTPVSLNTDGTVSPTGYSGTSILTSSNVIGAFGCSTIGSAYDPTTDTSVTVVRAAANNYVHAYATTIAGTTFTNGAATAVENASTTQNPCVVYLSPSKFLVVYQNATLLTAKILTVSGTTITVGTATTISSGSAPVNIRLMATSETTALVALAASTNVIGFTVTVNTTTWTCSLATTAVLYAAGSSALGDLVFDTTLSKGVMSRIGVSATFYQNFHIISNNATVQTAYPFSTGIGISGYSSRAAILPNTGFVVSCTLSGMNGFRALIIYSQAGGTAIVSDTTLLPISSASYISTIIYNPATSMIYCIELVSNGTTRVTPFEYDPVNFKFGKMLPSETISVGQYLNVMDGVICNYVPSQGAVLITYLNSSNSYPNSILYRYAASNVSDYLGIASNSAVANDPVMVVWNGVTETNQTSLEITSKYYINQDGTLGTTYTSKYAGKAVTATKLLT